MLTLAGVALAFGCFADPISAQEKWGTIKGRIVWGGKDLPERVDLTPLIQKNPDGPYCLKDGKVYDEKWVVDPKNRGLQWTFVWLSNGKDAVPIHPKLKKLAKDVVEIDQPVCMYVPHGIALREGQTLLAKNNARVSHNILYIGPNGAGNPLILPGKEFKLEGLKASPAPTSMSCSIHPWMKAWVRVFDHPYYAVTDKDGNFEIKDAPAGKYNLVVWHGSGGYRFGAAGRAGQPIVIDAEKTKDLGDLRYPPPKTP